nr:inactive protein kinase SELMODRAFT_444075-like isoform X1 [Ipomoea batatas]
MNLRQKSVKDRSLDVAKRVVLVCVKASREIPRAALAWTLTHVVQPGDCVKLLVVIPDHHSSNLWGFSRFHSDCAHTNGKSFSGTVFDQKDYITDSCAQIMLQLNDLYDPNKIQLKIKVISGSECGVVAAEAMKTQTHWVVLDKKMKKEAKICLEELECNVVMMKNSHPKILRMNFVGSPSTENEVIAWSQISRNLLTEIRVPNVTPVSSPEHVSSTTTAARTSSISSSELEACLLATSDFRWDLKKGGFPHRDVRCLFDESDSDTDIEKLISPSTSISSKQSTADTFSSSVEYSKFLKKGSQKLSKMRNFTGQDIHGKFFELDPNLEVGGERGRLSTELSKNVRKMVLLSKSSPPDPPPLCSVCQHKAPVFGKPPRWFTYAELETATRGFSKANFLAEGGYGSVHRGVLPDGQVVAVKQHKSASSQGDREFCSEVEVLSCAQHRNVVTLIGFCIEDGRRLLVYEYICNGSLDSHLYGQNRDPLNWSARQKIALGAARGLRYLHEECRVGCIVHRDMRPNNILLTHDFEPLVGDFGLARWQPDGDLGVETRIIGTFGYLAPEYARSGQITEKADVYSFGVVLVELITGRKVMDIYRPKGQQCLTEWARPLLKENAITDLIDPCIRNCYLEQEVRSMMHCASSCIQPDPLSRPRMSQPPAALFRSQSQSTLSASPPTFIYNVSEEDKANDTAEKKPIFVHPSALVHPSAILGEGVAIGPFCTIGASVTLGNACQLYPGSHIFGKTILGENCTLMTGAVVGDDLPGYTIIGSNNVIGHHAVVGVKCQDLKYKLGSECFLEVGDNNEIREHTSIHRSSKPCDKTVIGDNNLIMGSCHIAHDCKVGNNNILANNTLLAGHVVVEDYTHTAGATVVHQFCHIGSFSFIGGGSVVSQDVPKYTMVSGERAELRGLNLEGLRRRGFSVMEIRSLRSAYRKIFMTAGADFGSFEDRLAEVEQHEELILVPAVSSMVKSIRDSFVESRRGICKFRTLNET